MAHLRGRLRETANANSNALEQYRFLAKSAMVSRADLFRGPGFLRPTPDIVDKLVRKSVLDVRFY